MNFSRIAALACAAFIAWAPASASANLPSTFAFASAPESYVGAGDHFVLSEPGTVFSVETFGNPGWLEIRMWTGLDLWLLQLTAPWGTAFEEGWYSAPSQVPNNNTPSLFLAGNHRADSFQTGVFHILELAYDSSGAVASLAVDFLEYDNLVPNQWNAGQIRINSDVPVVAVPEPATYALMMLGLVGILYTRRRHAGAERRR